MADYICEVELAAGLEAIATTELREIINSDSLHNLRTSPGALQFGYSGDLNVLSQLKTVVSVYLLAHLDVPRPKAILGHQNFHMLLDMIKTVRSLHPPDQFKTLYLSAAGSDSSVMQRIKQEISTATNLSIDDNAGDLMLRIRRSGNGWDILIRTTPRPLATRDWRVCNFEGALNGPVAAAITRLTQPAVDDVIVNLAAGSGTLIVERALLSPYHSIIGVDLDGEALHCAEQNIMAAGLANASIELIPADTRSLPIAASSANVLMADLPFGQLVGSHEENLKLYPELLSEAARIAVPDARFVLITHEVRLMEKLLRASHEWLLDTTIKVSLRGLHPRIYVLRKRDEKLS